MARTLLQIINQVQSELGLPVAATVIGNTDATTAQMLAFANAELDELRRAHDWTVLQTEYNLAIATPLITTGNVTLNSPVVTNIPSTATLVPQYWQVAGSNLPLASRILSVDSATQVTLTMESTGTVANTPLTFSQDTYPEPVDFDHFIGNTWWDRTNHWQLLGPDSPQVDQWHRSGIFAVGPRRHFRQLGPYANTYRIWPPPADLSQPIQLVFEYLSSYCVWVAGSKTSFASSFANDTDVPKLDDRAIIMGVKWRFWAQKGMNFTLMRSDYDRYIERAIARDGGADIVSLVREGNSLLISSANIQDGNWPGNIGTNTS